MKSLNSKIITTNALNLTGVSLFVAYARVIVCTGRHLIIHVSDHVTHWRILFDVLSIFFDIRDCVVRVRCQELNLQSFNISPVDCVVQ